MTAVRITVLFIATIFFTQTMHAQPADSGYYRSFDNTNIYYHVEGAGYPVVLVHGFIVNSSSWKTTALYKDLLKEGYKVIIMDLRGNGRSGKPHTPEAYANDAEAKDIIGLLQSLHIQHYDLVGYSRGSIISARLMVRDSRIHKVVLGGMGADFTDTAWARKIMFYHALMGDTIKELEGMVTYVKKAGLDQTALAYSQKEQPATSKADLAKYTKEVLVICGDQDKDNGDGHELAKLMPGASFTEVKGVHNTAASTEEFAGKVIAFLKK